MICWCGSMAEQLICNQQVDGSTPFTSSIYGSVPERPKGADCKSVVYDFSGPNPLAPTKNSLALAGEFFSEINRSRGKIPLLCMKCASGKRNHFGDGRVSFFFLRGIRFSLKRETTVMKKCSD